MKILYNLLGWLTEFLISVHSKPRRIKGDGLEMGLVSTEDPAGGSAELPAALEVGSGAAAAPFRTPYGTEACHSYCFSFDCGACVLFEPESSDWPEMCLACFERDSQTKTIYTHCIGSVTWNCMNVQVHNENTFVG